MTPFFVLFMHRAFLYHCGCFKGLFPLFKMQSQPSSCAGLSQFFCGLYFAFTSPTFQFFIRLYAPWNWDSKYILALSGVSEVLVVQSCPTLCDPVDCSPPGSSIHGIVQAKTLEWFAIPFSKGPSQPRDQTRVSCIAGRCFTIWAPREA